MRGRIPRGIKNSNPGNIRINSDHFQGEIVPSQDASFKQFESMAYGYRAIFKILKNYDKKYFLRTIKGMISRWAPSSENNTIAYIKAVSSYSGIGEDDPVDSDNREQMIKIVAGMSKVEIGRDPDIHEIEDGWNLL